MSSSLEANRKFSARFLWDSSQIRHIKDLKSLRLNASSRDFRSYSQEYRPHSTLRVRVAIRGRVGRILGGPGDLATSGMGPPHPIPSKLPAPQLTPGALGWQLLSRDSEPLRRQLCGGASRSVSPTRERPAAAAWPLLAQVVLCWGPRGAARFCGAPQHRPPRGFAAPQGPGSSAVGSRRAAQRRSSSRPRCLGATRHRCVSACVSQPRPREFHPWSQPRATVPSAASSLILNRANGVSQCFFPRLQAILSHPESIFRGATRPLD